eukprot:4717949-Pyramimonas_sp.AAC.1
MAMDARGACICLKTISMNDWARLGKAAPKPSATRASARGRVELRNIRAKVAFGNEAALGARRPSPSADC